MRRFERPAIDLDGPWRFVPDAEQAFEVDRLPPGQAIAVPGCWEAQVGRPYQIITAWYSRTFDVPAEWTGSQALVRFGAVMYHCLVWLNGQLVGQHEGGYTEFTLPLGGAIHPGRNELTVRVTNPLNGISDYPALAVERALLAEEWAPDLPLTQAPHGKQTWYSSQSGIWRSVSVERTADVWVDSLRVLPDVPGGQARAHIPRSYLMAAVVALVVVGGSASASGRSPSVTPSMGAPDSFQNPVIDRNFADPGVVRTDDAWYAYATGDLTVNIQVARSSDLVSWERVGEALPRLPFWQPSAKGLTWAPEVVRVGEGYVMYYTGRDVQAGKQCLSTATATAPEGPFVDASDEPLLCQVELGGSIDPYPFVARNGTRYLLWKNDGNCCGLPTRIWMQRLSDDGLEVTGEAVDLGVRDDAPWEGALIEAPTLVEREGRFYLFYSANAYDSEDYAIGYAVADELLGPYRDAADDPLVASGEGAAGPGGQAIVTEPDGDQWLLYHAWDSARIGDGVGGRRALWLDPLRFEAGRPIVEGPNGDPQPLPQDR